MTLLVYAVAEDERVLPAGLTGLAEHPLRALRHRELAALVGECRGPVAATHAALWRFEQTIERLMDDRTVLPARFGTTLPDAGAVEQWLAGRHDRLADGLRRVSGAVELGVRAGWAEDGTAAPNPPSGANPGTEYLLGRLDRRRRAGQIADEIDAAVGALARQRSRRILARPEIPVSAAYLVARPRVEEFLARCHSLQERIAQVRLVCTGPWPPYSFVTREDS